MTNRAISFPSALGLTCSIIAMVCVMGPTWADTRPTGGRVVAGDAVIGGRQNGLLINQSSDRAVIDWTGFSIGNGQTVNFDNGDGATLNRVTGNRVSRIDGSLTATGSVFVINDNGVVIGRDGVVDVGGSFVASTLGVTTGGFMQGGDQSFVGQSGASVINFGRIGALGGDVALIGAQVVNRGDISAPQGTAGLVAGYDVIMRDAALADGQFVVRLGGPDTGVLNAGRIEAASAELRANGGNVLALAGNTDGLIRAEGIVRDGGRIFLIAPGGRVAVDSTVEARSSTGAGGEVVLNADDVSIDGLIDVSGLFRRGGEITVEGGTIWVGPTAVLDAGGATGGLIRVGGDLRGGTGDLFGAPMETARNVSVADGAQINADGTAGSGGSIVLWADRNMNFSGQISATGTDAGTGGFAEVSGGYLLYNGTADLRAASGAFGDLLLDPFNITISTGASSGNSNFTATGNDSVINVDTLVAALGTANVTVSTGDGSGPQEGNITVSAPIIWTSGSDLTLNAAGNISIDRAIRARNGGLFIDSGNDVTASGAIDVGLFDLVSGFWVQRYETVLPAFRATDFRVSDGTFLRAISNCGDCSLFFEDVYGLQGIANNPALEFEYMYLGDHIDATGTSNWNDGDGFVPIGTQNVPFGAVLDGDGYAIVGLTINRPDEVGVGLFGYLEDALIDEIRLVDADIGGLASVGAIAGYAGAFAFGSFLNSSLIRNSWATGTVSAVNNRAGGLVGDADALSIESSWARVDVTGRSLVGGLVGELEMSGSFFDYGGLYDTYAVGSVTATGASGIAGGLIGQASYPFGSFNDTPTPTVIGTSYASGALSGATVGGLIGSNEFGYVYESYWDTETTGAAVGIGTGTAIGSDNRGLTSADARDPASYVGFNAGNDTWYMSPGLRPMLYSTYSQEIHVPEELQILASYTNTDAELMRDIDMVGILDNAAGIWGPLGWEPIGWDGNRYSGDFDGAGHVIDGLIVNRPDEEYAGLFGSATDTTISDLGLTNVSILGMNYAGGLAGRITSGSSTISNIFVTGDVTSSGSTGFEYTGGLIGLANQADISNVMTDVSVRGTSQVGGVIGWLYDADLSYASAIGPVRGNSFVGGLVGASGIDSLSFGPTTISQSFSSGRVTGADPETTGGLIGAEVRTTVTGSFWDTQSTRQSEGIGDGTPTGIVDKSVPGLIGLTTAQFQNTATFMTLAVNLGWDFTETWAPSSRGFYPTLFALSPVVALDMDPVSRTYGQGNGSLVINGISYGGTAQFLFGPDDDVLVINRSTLLAGVGRDAPVGSYEFGAGGLTSSQGVSYRVVNIGGGLTIRPALLTVTSDDFVKIYGEADPDFDFRISGFVLGEGRSLVTGALGRVAGESVAARRYALTLGTLSAGPNYALRLAGNDGLRIRPATLTVTTDDFVKVYGDDDPEFDFLVSGFVFNDGMSLVSGALGRVSGEDVSARPYRLTLGTLSAGRNYRLQFADRGGLLITQRALTIAADDIGQFFGAQDEPLTWSIVDGRLVFNDTITGGLEREEGSQPGIYAILQGNLTGGPNYAITFEPGTLTISPSEEIRNTERGAKEDTFVDVPELILDPEEEVEVPDQADGDDALNASIEQTDEIVREIEDASSYCSIIGQSEYVVDCLSERLAVIAAKLPTSGDYGPARAAIDQAARQLSALVAANEDRDFPAGLTRSLRPDAPASGRPLRAVRTDSLEETLAAASGIMRNTQTLLLRSIPESAESVHYQRIATAVGTGSTLLRSI